MPLTPKGKKIKSAMKKHYGSKKGEQVFYASQNKGNIKGTHKSYRAGSLEDEAILREMIDSYRAGTLGSYQAGTGGGLYGGAWKALNPEGQRLATQQIEADPMARARARGGQQSNQRRREIMQGLAGQYGVGGGGAGAGGGAGGVGGAGGGGADVAPGTAGTIAEYGEGLLDPTSDLSKRWMEQMREQIGDQADAAQRAAGYQAAQSGFGAGASPELMQMQSDIATQGLEAGGQAASDFMLRAPEMGLGALQGAGGLQVGMRGQDLQSRMAAEQNQLQRELANSQRMMQQREMDMQRQLQDQQLQMQRNQLDQDRYLRELAYTYQGGQLPQGGGSGYGGYGGGGYGGGGGGVRAGVTPGLRGRTLGFR